jgi:hypothetical protein
MTWMGIEPTIPVFEREKTFHALDRAASVIGSKVCIKEVNNISWERTMSVFDTYPIRVHFSSFTVLVQCCHDSVFTCSPLLEQPAAFYTLDTTTRKPHDCELNSRRAWRTTKLNSPAVWRRHDFQICSLRLYTSYLSGLQHYCSYLILQRRKYHLFLLFLNSNEIDKSEEYGKKYLRVIVTSYID